MSGPSSVSNSTEIPIRRLRSSPELLILLWVLFLLAPNLLWILVANDPADAFMRGLAPGIAAAAFVAAWFPDLRWPIRLSLPFQALVPAESYYVALYHQPSSSLILGIIGESNLREAVEYLGPGTLLFLSATGMVLALLGWRLSNLLRSYRVSRHHKWLRLASMLPVILLAYLEFDWYTDQAEAFALPKHFHRDARLADMPPSPAKSLLVNSYPLGVPFRIVDYLREHHALQSISRDILNIRVAARRITTPAPPEVYVLVIGESANASHWQLNGYPRETNPFLSRQDGLVSLDNVISPWNATRLAVPVLITGMQSADGRAPLVAPSIIQIFGKVGFATYWLSNQMPLGLHDSVIAVHAHSADTVLFTNPGDIDGPTPYDGVILDPFRQHLKDPAPRKFFVIHLMGSHKDYGRRFPGDFSHFSHDEQHDLIDEYDDSLRYTDYILERIIQAIESIPGVRASVLYVSDHGETLPESGCTLSGHGYNTDGDYRVAAMIWLSKRLRTERPDVMHIFSSRRSWPFVSTHAAETLADIAEIAYAGWEHRNSWLNPGWTPGTRRVDVTDDFDHAQRKGPCKRLAHF